MTITQLQYFQAVCQNGNIKTAAESLHVSQPAISNSLRDLEQELQLNLLSRTPKGTFPTEDGKTFLKCVNDFLFGFERLGEVAKDISGAHNSLRCGASPMLGSCMLPEIYSTFRQKYPEIDIDLSTEEGLYPLYDKLSKDELDVLLVPGLNIPDTMNYHTMCNERLLFCVYNSHPLAERVTLSPKEIADTPLVILPLDYLQYRLVHNLFEEYGMEPNILLCTKQLSMIRNFVIAGIAGGFLYESYIERNFQPEELAVFDIGMPSIPFSVVWKKDGYLFSSTRKFIECIKDLDLDKE